MIYNLRYKIESNEITEQELHQIMDNELIKPENEMDTEIIDLCASALCKIYNIVLNEIPMYKPWEHESNNKNTQ